MTKTLFTNPAFYGTVFIFLLMFVPFAVLIPDRRRKKIIACICVIIISFGITSLFFIDQAGETERWNGGICADCGGIYELSAVFERLITTFYYTCNNCGHTVSFAQIMK